MGCNLPFFQILEFLSRFLEKGGIFDGISHQNHIKSLHVFEAIFWNVSESNKSNISEDQAAEKSSWHGLTTLIDGFSWIPNSHDFDHAFSDFHRRLSTDLTQNADFQAKLTQAFNRFKTLRDN